MKPLLLAVLLIPSFLCQTNPKTRCSLECYAKCMQSGTASASTCNCPPTSSSSCTKFAENLKSAIISQTLPKTRTTYIDAHMIRVSIDPQPSAFAYIFEFSTISSDSNQWTFAGASDEPHATFSINDPCRDYHFRVLIVIRSSNPDHIFEFIRPQPIAVQLPPFILTQEQISVELPRLTNTSSGGNTDEMLMYVKWSLPTGYTDSDIYGYESPALYPIQCSTPEGELAQPRIEIVKGGGRLAVSLPLSILETRCRMWVEVKMLPRCIRLEPFNVQKNIEIDCAKNPDLDVCNKDSNPICFDDIDVAGERGKVRISWRDPTITHRPIYYHVRYGPAQMKGVAPFVSWQLAAKREVRVDGSLNTFTLDIPEDEDFGVQVCAIMSKKRKRPKFGVVKVNPFQCSSCKSTQNSVRCGDCSAILGSTVLESDWLTRNTPKTKPPPSNNNINTTIYRMETDLAVKPHAASETLKSTDAPISIEKAKRIIETTTVPLTTTTMTTTTTLGTTTTVPPTTSTTTTTTATTTTITKAPTTLKKLRKITTTTTTVPPVNETRKMLSEEVEKSMKMLEKVINSTVPLSSDYDIDLESELETKLEEATKQLQQTITNLAGNSTDVRHHEKSKKCLTSDGVVCEFGCETRKRCACPTLTHARLRNGVCANRDTMLHTQCFPKREVNATWDAETGNVMVRRNDAIHQIDSADAVDKLFVEFGSVEIENSTIIDFNNVTRSKIVVQLQTLRKSSVFSTEPFIFHVNHSIDINTTYGMRFCVFNSSQIKDPQTFNWDDISKLEEVSELVPIVSPVKFTNSLKLYGTVDSYWSTVVTMAKIAILVVLAIAMFILVYLNCTRIKSLYERKRTHYFRPFYIDPSIHTTALKRDPSRGYYDVRTSNLIM